jgi:hypothetical protein
MDQLNAIERRRRNLRIALFGIILATLPFYCVGIFLWIRAPQNPNARATELARTQGPVAATFTVGPLATTPSVRATNTPFGQLSTPLPPLINTPGQFLPPAVTRVLSPTPIFVFPTAITPTAFIFPTASPAPTLTLAPTETPFPTATLEVPTPLPFPTETPIPPPADSDGDGISDNLDVCPFVVGLPPDGCPLPTATVETPTLSP